MPRYVSHLEGAIDGTRLPADELATLHKDRPILVRYDLPAVARHFSKISLQERPQTLWRYREL
ncbi:MAG TPA: threonine synthase, partial [Pirellulaceae bacterium]|nr:threonine synthase [Pirellulaceae bacterium]